MADDDELADRVAAGPAVKETKAVRRMSDWSPTVELLTAILDRLGDVGQAIAALGGAKPRQIPRAPHPTTALERARHRRRKDNHRSLVSRMLPHKAQPPDS